MLKFMVVATLFTMIFISCKKTNETVSPDLENLGNIQVKNGLVSFSNFAIYLKTVENKNEEQQKLQNKLTTENFSSLRSKPFEANPSSFVAGAINSFTNAFDSSLYTEYMLSVLNTDKIFEIDDFWVKVDMDNNFCNALDKTLYPTEYNDLVTNSTTNSHIMHFLSQDEPVLDALSGIRKGSLTWDTYQDYVGKKGGQGICFRTGGTSQYNQNFINLHPSPFKVYATAKYTRNFLHFELTANGIMQGNNGSIGSIERMFGTYSWEGVCKGSDSGTFTFSLGSNIWNYTKVFYSGGSALIHGTVRTTTQPRGYATSTTASINF